jgi:hypothetical protein
MKAKDALKLHKGDEVIEKSTGMSIQVICAFDDLVGENFDQPVVMIEGTRSDNHYDHWSSDQIK